MCYIMHKYYVVRVKLNVYYVCHMIYYRLLILPNHATCVRAAASSAGAKGAMGAAGFADTPRNLPIRGITPTANEHGVTRRNRRSGRLPQRHFPEAKALPFSI